MSTSERRHSSRIKQEQPRSDRQESANMHSNVLFHTDGESDVQTDDNKDDTDTDTMKRSSSKPKIERSAQ
eukprot:5223721-Pyramimonas_sp.AAC.1